MRHTCNLIIRFPKHFEKKLSLNEKLALYNLLRWFFLETDSIFTFFLSTSWVECECYARLALVSRVRVHWILVADAYRRAHYGGNVGRNRAVTTHSDAVESFCWTAQQNTMLSADLHNKAFHADVPFVIVAVDRSATLELLTMVGPMGWFVMVALCNRADHYIYRQHCAQRKSAGI